MILNFPSKTDRQTGTVSNSDRVHLAMSAGLQALPQKVELYLK